MTTDFVISNARSFTGDLFEELSKARPAKGGGYYKRVMDGKGKLRYFHSKGAYERWCERNDIEPHVDGQRALTHSTYIGSGAGSSGEKGQMTGKKHGGRHGPGPKRVSSSREYPLTGKQVARLPGGDVGPKRVHGGGTGPTPEREFARQGRVHRSAERGASPPARTIKRVGEGGVHVSKVPTAGTQAGRTAHERGSPGRSGRVSMTRSADSQGDEFDVLLKGDTYTGKGKRTGSPGSYKYTYAEGYTDIPEYKLRVTQQEKGLGDGESHAEIAAKLKAGIETKGPKADICQTNPPVCAGNLGIIRDDMPQFDTDAFPDVVNEYLQEFRDESVKVTSGTSMKVSQLKATQREIQTKKAYKMASARKDWEESMAAGQHGMYEGQFGRGDWHPAKDAVVVSSDGYILDGHHRWAAMMIASPGSQMPVHIVDAPIKTLLAKSEKFYREGRGVKKASIGAESIGAKKSMTAGYAWVRARARERLNKALAEAKAILGRGDEFEDLMEGV